jgi:hypothetical protein
MNQNETLSPSVAPDITLDESIKEALLPKTEQESQVIVHVKFTADFPGSKIRIWKSTFLHDRDSSHRSELLHTDNIPLFPKWKEIMAGEKVVFTLIFSALPKDCLCFDLIETIPEPGGFVIKNIQRNETDVYRIDL